MKRFLTITFLVIVFTVGCSACSSSEVLSSNVSTETIEPTQLVTPEPTEAPSPTPAPTATPVLGISGEYFLDTLNGLEKSVGRDEFGSPFTNNAGSLTYIRADDNGIAIETDEYNNIQSITYFSHINTSAAESALSDAELETISDIVISFNSAVKNSINSQTTFADDFSVFLGLISDKYTDTEESALVMIPETSVGDYYCSYFDTVATGRVFAIKLTPDK